MIYDCFMFFNELELLEIRLHELEEVVDRFVLVESAWTHSGKRKPLHFARHRARFAAFRERIIPVVAGGFPQAHCPRCREAEQRNSILLGLSGAEPDDRILISDVDEIPRAAAVARAAQSARLQVFTQRFSYYFLNLQKGPWHGTRMISYANLVARGGPEAVRVAPRARRVPDGGWHFSYAGGVERIRAKLDAFSHQEYNTSRFTDPEHIRRVMESGSDLFERDRQRFRPTPPAELPRHVIRNRRQYRHLLWPPDREREALVAAWRTVARLAGAVVVLGPPDGADAAALADVCDPKVVLAVCAPDRAARLPARGTIKPVGLAPSEFLARASEPYIKLLYVPAARNRPIVTRAMRLLVPGGVIFGCVREGRWWYRCTPGSPDLVALVERAQERREG